MIIYLFVTRLTGPEVEAANIAGIRLDGESLMFAYRPDELWIGNRKRPFIAGDYVEYDWCGGRLGYGWIQLTVSDHTAALILNWLRDCKWTASNLPVQWLEKWTGGKFYNLDMIELQGAR